jgi:hypothetical protein
MQADMRRMFLCLDGQTVIGPYDIETLRSAISNRRDINENSLCCDEGKETWRALGEAAPVLFAARTTAPNLPTNSKYSPHDTTSKVGNSQIIYLNKQSKLIGAFFLALWLLFAVWVAITMLIKGDFSESYVLSLWFLFGPAFGWLLFYYSPKSLILGKPLIVRWFLRPDWTLDDNDIVSVVAPPRTPCIKTARGKIALSVFATEDQEAICKSLAQKHGAHVGFPDRVVQPIKLNPTFKINRPMNLINCPACQQEISAQAASCPKCGHPIQSLPPELFRYSSWDIAGMSLLGFALLIFWAMYEGRMRNPEFSTMNVHTFSTLQTTLVVFIAVALLLFGVGHFAPRLLPASLHGKSRRARHITFIVITSIVAALVVLATYGKFRIDAIERGVRTEALERAMHDEVPQ